MSHQHEHHEDHHHHHEHHHTHEHEHEHEALPCDGEGHEHHHHADGTCCCEHHAEEFHGIEKPMLARLIIAALCYLAGMLIPDNELFTAFLMLATAVLAGYDIVIGAVKNLANRKFFDEYFLMCFAAIAAFIIGEFEEGAVVFLLYRIGTFCQSYAIRHSQRTIANLTGEDHPAPKTDKPQNAFITRFAQIYTPVILIAAVLTAFYLAFLTDIGGREAIYRALNLLVIACPCSIVISVPLAYFAGIAAAGKAGIFFHDSTAVDHIAKLSREDSPVHTEHINHKDAKVYSFGHAGDFHNADLVITGEKSFSDAISVAKHCRVIALENVWFTIIIKLAVLLLSVFGISALWFAVFADSGVTIITVLNALRAFRTKK